MIPAIYLHNVIATFEAIHENDVLFMHVENVGQTKSPKLI